MRFKLLIAFFWLSTLGFASEIVVDSDGTVYRCDNECVETGGQPPYADSQGGSVWIKVG